VDFYKLIKNKKKYTEHDRGFENCLRLFKGKIYNNQKEVKMENNIKRTEKVTKRYRDDWIDEQGKLHTKITKEIITGPLDNVQAGQKIEEPLLQRIIRPLRNKPRMMIQGVPVKHVQQFQQPQQAPQAQPIPQAPLDINALMTIGKKLLEDSGIDLQDLLSKALNPESSEEKPETLTDEREVNQWQKKKTKTLNQKIKKKQLKKKIQTKIQNKKD